RPCSYSVCVWCFCSSRRRHTRSKRDWSSDVCSSDLVQLRALIQGQLQEVHSDAIVAEPLVDGDMLGNIAHPPEPTYLGIVAQGIDRKSTRLNSSHVSNSYAVFYLKKKKLKNSLLPYQ